MQNTHLKAHFQTLSDEELTSRVASGGLTDIAQNLAETELSVRGLPIPEKATTEKLEAEEYLGDMVVLEQGLNPTDAYILCSLLNSAGITADVGDANLVQANELLAIAVGGVRIRVPATQITDAKELLEAYNRGAFALDRDFDAGETAA